MPNTSPPITSTQNLDIQVIKRSGGDKTVNIGVTSENSELIPAMEQALQAQGIRDFVIHGGGSFVVAQALCDNQLDAAMVADSNLIEAACPGALSPGSQDLYTAYVEFWAAPQVLQELGFVGQAVSLSQIVAALSKPNGEGGMCLASSVPVYSKSGNTAYMAFAGANHNNEPTFTAETAPSLKAIYENRCLSSESTAWLMEKAFSQGQEWLQQNRTLIVGYNTLFNRPFVSNNVTVDYKTLNVAPIQLTTPLEVVPTAFWRQEENAEKFRLVFEAVAQSPVAKAFDQVEATKTSNVLRPFSGTRIREGIQFYNTEVRDLAGWVLVLDTSGSMRGAGLDGLQRGTLALVDQENAKKYGLYGPEDRFSALAFSGRVNPLQADSRNNLTQELVQLKAEGGTYLFKAARQAIDLASKDGTGIIVFFSDGDPSDQPDPDLIERYRQFTEQEGGKVIFVAVGDIEPNQVQSVAQALSATPIYSDNVNETAQEFLKGVADAL
ncbi:MAG: VWA domain-containing protein [Synechocystis sp.]|jgi:Mg-chelatase subunit ChlD